MEPLYLEVFAEFPQVKGFFATKNGASEGSPYYHEETIQRQGLETMNFVWPGQVHKDHIEVIEKRREEPQRFPDTDGVITNVPEVLLTTVHADCLPVYFFDPEKKAIGLVHAGWRGSVLGIAAKAARKMADVFSCRPEDIRAFIGPGISRCCFETGPEVIQAFREAFDFADEFAEPKGEKYNIDLKGINKRQLLREGLEEGHIAVSAHCTCCEPELFCSYRREGGTYKRMGAGLCLL
jgi:YfiH family protein